jgi:molybdopterin synthase sulfur carrier subunit
MEILFFGIAKDIVGVSQKVLLANENFPNSVRELKQKLNQEYPELIKLSSLAVAVNSEYAKDDVLLKDTDEVAIIPPVSGG